MEDCVFFEERVLVYVQYLFFGGHFLLEWFVVEGLKEVVAGTG
jgi:hypothetical protein